MRAKKTYTKPEFKYWPAKELDAIEATMSRGEGGSNYYFVWDYNPVIGDSSSAIGGVILGTLIGIVVAIVTKSGALGRTVAGLVADAIADLIIAENLDVVYYRSYDYLLRAFHINHAVAGFVAGEARVTEFFADKNHKFSLDTPSMYINISSDAQHMLRTCPGYELINSLLN